MADMIKFFKGLEASLPATGVNGALYITTDEGAIYLGTGTGMKRLGDFVQVDKVASLPEKAHESCLYYCVAENILAKWNGTEWKQINKQPTAEELKVLLGLGSLAYKSEVAEGDLNSDLASKINAASGAQHTHANKDLLDTYTQTEADLADAVAKKHAHTFVESELNKIVDGDVAKWNAVAADHLTASDKTALEDAIKEAKKAGTDANTNIEAYKVTNDARVLAVEEDIAEITNADNGILAQAKSYSDGKLATAKSEISAEIDADVKVVNDALEAYKTSNNAEVAKKANASDVVANDTFESFKTTNTQAIADAKAGAISEIEAKGYAVATEVAGTYATKTELGNVDAKFANYNTTAVQKGIDDAQDARIKAIEDDYLVEADIANFETKENVKKVADDLAEIAKDYLKAEDKTELSDAIALKADKSVVDAMYTNDQIDGFLNGKVDKTAYEADKETFALKSEITSLAGKADKSYVDEELAKKVNVADYNNDKATFALKTDLNAYRTSADQDVIDQDFEGRIAELEAIDHDQLAKDASAAAVATVLDGAPEKFDTLKEIAAWIAEADTAEDAASLVTRVSALEAIDHEAYVDADAALKEELEGKINAIDNHSHTFVESELNKIADGDVAKWNAEIGAKELAASKTTTAEVKEQIEAYGYATEADLTLAEGRIEALEGVKDDYKTADATLKAELQAEIDADVKVVSDALATAKTEISAEIDADVKALADNVYTKAQVYTQEEVDALISAAHTWGEF